MCTYINVCHSVSHSLSLFTHELSLTLSHSLTHTHTHTLSLSLSLSLYIYIYHGRGITRRCIWLDVPAGTTLYKASWIFKIYFLWWFVLLLVGSWPQAGGWSTLPGSPLWKCMMLNDPKHLMSLGRTSLTMWSGAPECIFIEIGMFD